jgi:hypothetical protein
MEELSYQVVDGFGDGIDNPSVEQMREFLERLNPDDEEHSEVSLTHDQTSWTLSCFLSSKIVFYQHEHEYKPRHLTGVSREKMLELWQKLAKGQFDELEKELWQPGHSPV